MHPENFYTAFGCLACAFARMEADLRALIAGLAFGENTITASVFLDSSQLAENSKKLRKLAREHEELEPAMVEIAHRIDKLRESRNLFIHGIWEDGSLGLAGGGASVRDLNTSYEKQASDRLWASGRAKKFTIDDFNTLLTEVDAITASIGRLWNSLANDDETAFPMLPKPGHSCSLRLVIRSDGALAVVDGQPPAART